MTTPMEIDTDILTTDVPEVQTVNSLDPDPEPTTDATTSKKKGRRPAGEGGAAKKKEKEERVPGTTSLPVARVKRILGADEDLQNIGREALFLLSIATVSELLTIHLSLRILMILCYPSYWLSLCLPSIIIVVDPNRSNFSNEWRIRDT